MIVMHIYIFCFQPLLQMNATLVLSADQEIFAPERVVKTIALQELVCVSSNITSKALISMIENIAIDSIRNTNSSILFSL